MSLCNQIAIARWGHLMHNRLTKTSFIKVCGVLLISIVPFYVPLYVLHNCNITLQSHYLHFNRVMLQRISSVICHKTQFIKHFIYFVSPIPKVYYIKRHNLVLTLNYLAIISSYQASPSKINWEIENNCFVSIWNRSTSFYIGYNTKRLYSECVCINNLHIPLLALYLNFSFFSFAVVFPHPGAGRRCCRKHRALLSRESHGGPIVASVSGVVGICFISQRCSVAPESGK